MSLIRRGPGWEGRFGKVRQKGSKKSTSTKNLLNCREKGNEKKNKPGGGKKGMLEKDEGEPGEKQLQKLGWGRGRGGWGILSRAVEYYVGNAGGEPNTFEGPSTEFQLTGGKMKLGGCQPKGKKSLTKTRE